MYKSVLKIPSYASHVMALFEDHSASSWIVGGYVRDALLNRPSHDIDIATTAPWKKVESICLENGLKVFRTGIKHGTVSVFIQNHTIEVTTLRKEGTYSDFRHPDEIIFTDSIEEDLQRRDITINALAYNPQVGIVDPFGGISDLQHGIIRSVGDPRKRFHEDPLRILRVLRFSSTLGFQIDPETAQAAHDCAPLIQHIAKERIHHELTLAFQGQHFAEILPHHAAILAEVTPALTNLLNASFVNRYAVLVQALPKDFVIRISALIYEHALFEGTAPEDDSNIESTSVKERALNLLSTLSQELRLTKKEHSSIATLLSFMDIPLENSTEGVQRTLSVIRAPETFRQLLVLKKAQTSLESNLHRPIDEVRTDIEKLTELQQIEDHLQFIIDHNLPYLTTHLDISGADLIALGFPSDQTVGKTLNELLLAVISGEIVNNRKNLLNFSKKFKNSVDGLGNVL